MDVNAAVTSLSVIGEEVVVGTVASDIYQIRLSFQLQTRNPRKPGRAAVQLHDKTKNSNNRIKSSYDNKKTQRKSGSEQINATLLSQPTLKLDSAAPEMKLLATCHSEPICDVTFPR